jgi:hypothetical protein
LLCQAAYALRATGEKIRGEEQQLFWNVNVDKKTGKTRNSDGRLFLAVTVLDAQGLKETLQLCRNGSCILAGRRRTCATLAISGSLDIDTETASAIPHLLPALQTLVKTEVFQRSEIIRLRI